MKSAKFSTKIIEIDTILTAISGRKRRQSFQLAHKAFKNWWHANKTGENDIAQYYGYCWTRHRLLFSHWMTIIANVWTQNVHKLNFCRTFLSCYGRHSRMVELRRLYCLCYLACRNGGNLEHYYLLKNHINIVRIKYGWNSFFLKFLSFKLDQ